MKTSRTATKTWIVLLLGCAAIPAACSFRATAPSLTQERDPMTSTEVLAAGATAGDAAMRSRAQALLGKLPLYFIENRGQEDPRVAYYLQGRDTAVYFTGTGVTFALTAPKADGAAANQPPVNAVGDTPHGRHLPVRRVALAPEHQSRDRWAVQLDFVGANAVAPRGEDRTPAVVSYFKGADSRSQAGLPTYGSVVYPDLWPGIDLVYTGTAGHLKYTFLVKPGADPDQIKLAYRGATAVALTDAGQLEIATPVGGFTDDRPYAYQDRNDSRDEVPAAFALATASGDGTQRYGFTVGRYDRSRPLVLDPSVLVYAGYIGGGGRTRARDRRGCGRQRVCRRLHGLLRAFLSRQGGAGSDLQRRLQRRLRGQDQGGRQRSRLPRLHRRRRRRRRPGHRRRQGGERVRDRHHGVGREHLPGQGGTAPDPWRRR